MGMVAVASNNSNAFQPLPLPLSDYKMINKSMSIITDLTFSLILVNMLSFAIASRIF